MPHLRKFTVDGRSKVFESMGCHKTKHGAECGKIYFKKSKSNIVRVVKAPKYLHKQLGLYEVFVAKKRRS